MARRTTIYKQGGKEIGHCSPKQRKLSVTNKTSKFTAEPRERRGIAENLFPLRCLRAHCDSAVIDRKGEQGQKLI